MNYRGLKKYIIYTKNVFPLYKVHDNLAPSHLPKYFMIVKDINLLKGTTSILRSVAKNRYIVPRARVTYSKAVLLSKSQLCALH